jgi:hypothetical protein
MIHAVIDRGCNHPAHIDLPVTIGHKTYAKRDTTGKEPSQDNQYDDQHHIDAERHGREKPTFLMLLTFLHDISDDKTIFGTKVIKVFHFCNKILSQKQKKCRLR